MLGTPRNAKMPGYGLRAGLTIMRATLGVFGSSRKRSGCRFDSNRGCRESFRQSPPLRDEREAVGWGAEAKPMLIVHVHVHVKPESVADFRQTTLENARLSVQEPGIAGFDVIEQQDDRTRFVLIEVYRSPAAAAAHKGTAHYAKWRDEVADMMAEPRHGVKYNDVFPEPQDR